MKEILSDAIDNIDASFGMLVALVVGLMLIGAPIGLGAWIVWHGLKSFTGCT